MSVKLSLAVSITTYYASVCLYKAEHSSMSFAQWRQIFKGDPCPREMTLRAMQELQSVARAEKVGDKAQSLQEIVLNQVCVL